MSFFDRFRKTETTAPEVVDRDPAGVAIVNSGAMPLSSGYEGSTLYDVLTGGMSNAGVAVNEKTVLGISAVYACVNLIAGALASMPLPVYRDTKDGDREKVGGPVSILLNRQPCPSMTAAVYWEYMAAALLLKGDAFARILRPFPMSMDVSGYEPLHPECVEVKRSGDRLVYIVTEEDGVTRKAYDQADIVHIPGPGFDGLRGKSQIKHVMTTAAGIALAADQYSASFFKNGAKPDFAIEMEGKPTTEQVDEMRRVWQEKYGGVGKNHLPAVLFGGAKVHELTINAEDAQLIATRQFQVEDICRIFGVPPHMVGHTTNTTSWGTGIEHQGIGFVKYTLGRHLVKIQQEVNRKTWPSGDKFCEFKTAGLERGDFKTRNEGYRIGLGRAGEPAWLSVNEVRKLENLPPVEGGDVIPKNEGKTTDAPKTP